MVVFFALYYLTKFLVNRFPSLALVEKYLNRRLFYRTPIRFMIECYLKISHNSIFFLSIMGSFNTEETLSTIFNIFILVFVLLWPILLFLFLICKRNKLERRSFLQRFHSMYLNIKTDNYLKPRFQSNKASCFLYNVIFCVRRLAFVMSLFLLKNMYSCSIFFGFLFNTSLYVLYILETMPHIESYFNLLELFNEIFLLMIIYTLFGYTEGSNLTYESQWDFAYITITMLSIVFSINIVVMVYTTFKKLNK